MRRVAACVALACVTVVGAACSSSKPSTHATTTAAADNLPFEGSPSQAVLAEAAGLSFPASVAGYRSVRVGNDELDVSFTIAAADLDSFLSGSKLGALSTKRIISHPSPVWDLNPSGTIQSALSARNHLTRGVEIVATDTDPTTDTIRLIVARS